ncbi:hypothetical protein AMTRI_Chr10g228440 [Amborella trichopoda]
MQVFSNKSKLLHLYEYQWTSPHDDKLLEVMAHCVRDNLRTNGAFCREAWARITRKIKIKNRLWTLRTNYVNIKILIEEFGFRWIEEMWMVTTDWVVWEEYCLNYLLCNQCLCVHFAWLFYRKITVGHQNTRVRASLLWLTLKICLGK